MLARHKMSGHDAPWIAPRRSPEENPINAPMIISFFIFVYSVREMLSNRLASVENALRQAI
jgi:hypothetical protein